MSCAQFMKLDQCMSCVQFMASELRCIRVSLYSFLYYFTINLALPVANLSSIAPPNAFPTPLPMNAKATSARIKQAHREPAEGHVSNVCGFSRA